MSSTVIIGAGIIGCSTAYYLSQDEAAGSESIHLIEASPELFASASGKAGGFLAADWFSPSVAPLGALSFDLHRDLAQRDDGRVKWGYSSSISASFAESPPQGNEATGFDWLREGYSRAEAACRHQFQDAVGPTWLTRRHGDNIEILSEDGTAAQVDPLHLCQHLLSECTSLGVQLHQPARALGLETDVSNNMTGIKLLDTAKGTTSTIPCTTLLLAAGAWTPAVFQTLFPSSRLRLPISHLAGHSLVVRSPRWPPPEPKSNPKIAQKGPGKQDQEHCHAIFTTARSGFSPELFSRVNGEIYIAGLNSADVPLPALATDARVSAADVEELKRVATRLLCRDGAVLASPDDGEGRQKEEEDVKEELDVIRAGLCFRPVTPWGRPVLSRIADAELGAGVRTYRKGQGRSQGEGGVYVACGHGPWGIALSLGTGKVMAEMMMGSETSADVTGLAL